MTFLASVGGFSSAGGFAPGPTPTQALSAQTVEQYANITTVDLTSYAEAGSRFYSIDMPEGIEVMSKSARIIGAPRNTQSSTTHNIYVDQPTQGSKWLTIDFTVNAFSGTSYTGITAESGLTAQSEYGTSYSGAGCEFVLGAGATITLTSSWYDRFDGLTSRMIFRSSDPANPAKIVTNGNAVFTGGGGAGTIEGLSFVDIVFERLDPNSAVTPGNNWTVVSLLSASTARDLEDIAFIGCTFQSDVGTAFDFTMPGSEMTGMDLTPNAVNRLTIWDCEFTKLYNGVFLAGTNILVGRCDHHDNWGDLVRPSITAEITDTQYVLVCDNVLRNNVCDGISRHPDMLQFSAGITGSGTITHVEWRGDIMFDGPVRSLPSIDGTFWTNGSVFSVSTNQTGTTTNTSLYRYDMATAGADRTHTLPALSAVSEGWQQCIQNYSANESHTLSIVEDSGDGGSTVASISASGKAYRIYKSGGAWVAQVQGIGTQGGLYQALQQLDEVSDFLISHTMYVGTAYAAHRFGNDGGGNGIPHTARVENVLVVPLLPGDVDGDGIEDLADGKSGSGFSQPAVGLESKSATSDITIVNSVTRITEGADWAGSYTSTNNYTSFDADTTTTITNHLEGEGAIPQTRGDFLWKAKAKSTGSIGSDQGPLHFGPADMGYDFINKRWRLPGHITCSVAPVISLNATTYEVSTAPTFSGAGDSSDTYQWCLDGEPITGETGSTLAQANVDPGEVSVRITRPDATYGDCIVESNRLTET